MRGPGGPRARVAERRGRRPARRAPPRPCRRWPTPAPPTSTRRGCCRSPAARRCPSRLLRGMATIGGEAVAADPDSELVAALLALNAVFLVAHPEEPRESPALRFLRDPRRDLAGGGRAARARHPGSARRRGPRARGRAAVAAARRLRRRHHDPLGGQARAREDRRDRPRRPAGSRAGRRVEARAHLRRGRRARERRLARGRATCRSGATPWRAPPRADAWPGRSRCARCAPRSRAPGADLPASAPRARPALPPRAPAPLPNFTSGRVELQLNGRATRLEAEARTTLLELLRSAGVYGAKSGCGSGQLRRVRGAARRAARSRPA